MKWLSLESESDFEGLLSSDKTIAIFKHSTRCAISSMAKNRLESSWDKDLSDIPVYLLDLIRYRNVSNYIAQQLQITHQSPQLILITKGEVVYNASHSAISTASIKQHI